MAGWILICRCWTMKLKNNQHLLIPSITIYLTRHGQHDIEACLEHSWNQSAIPNREDHQVKDLRFNVLERTLLCSHFGFNHRQDYQSQFYRWHFRSSEDYSLSMSVVQVVADTAREGHLVGIFEVWGIQVSLNRKMMRCSGRCGSRCWIVQIGLESFRLPGWNAKRTQRSCKGRPLWFQPDFEGWFCCEMEITKVLLIKDSLWISRYRNILLRQQLRWMLVVQPFRLGTTLKGQ